MVNDSNKALHRTAGGWGDFQKVLQVFKVLLYLQRLAVILSAVDKLGRWADAINNLKTNYLLDALPLGQKEGSEK